MNPTLALFVCVSSSICTQMCCYFSDSANACDFVHTHTQGISTYACARMNSMYAKCYYYSNKTQRFVRDSSSRGGISLYAKVSGGNGREKVRNKSSIQMPVTCARAHPLGRGEPQFWGFVCVCVCVWPQTS